jgi:hypothetical protein
MRNKSLFIIFLTITLLSIPANAQKRKKQKIVKDITVVRKQTDKERRISIEKRMLKGEYLHDGSGELLYVGTINSVPALLKALELTPVRETDGKKSYVCTYAHAVSALRRITGQKLIDYQDWKNWWENYKQTKSKKE